MCALKAKVHAYPSSYLQYICYLVQIGAKIGVEIICSGPKVELYHTKCVDDLEWTPGHWRWKQLTSLDHPVITTR